MKHANLRAHIRHLCCMGLPAETLMPRLLPLVRDLVPADSAGFFWVDAAGHMQNLIAERMLSAPKMRLYFEHFYSGGKYDFRDNFLSRAGGGTSVAISESDAAFRQSAYYNEILQELDAHHVLYGIVRDHGTALGQLSLYRSKRDAGFSAHDRDALASIMHYVTHAVAAPALTGDAASAKASEFIDSADDDVILVDAEGTILQASDSGKRLAVQAAGGTFSRDFVGTDSAEVRSILARVVAQIKRGSGTPSAPQLALSTHWGRILLRAYQLGDDNADAIGENSAYAIRIARQEPMILKFARALQTLDLPPQQHEVAMLLARGLSNLDIAAQMNVSVNTVAYHIKQLFAGLEAHGRAELIERVIENAKE